MINIDAVSETSGKSGLWKFLTRRIICLALEDYNLILFHLNLVNDRLEPNLNILFHNEYK